MGTYLSVKADETPNSRKLEEAWTSTARITAQKFPQRAADVCAACAWNLLAAGKPEAVVASTMEAGECWIAVAVLP
jgi:hypothetical protein